MSTKTKDLAFYKKHARTAKTCVDAYASFSNDTDDEANIADLVTDLGHYADQKALHFPTLVRRGLSRWLVEKHDPESTDPASVAIYADGVEITSNPDE